MHLKTSSLQKQETLGGFLSSELEYCVPKIHYTQYIQSKCVHTQCDIIVCKMI